MVDRPDALDGADDITVITLEEEEDGYSHLLTIEPGAPEEGNPIVLQDVITDSDRPLMVHTIALDPDQAEALALDLLRRLDRVPAITPGQFLNAIAILGSIDDVPGMPDRDQHETHRTDRSVLTMSRHAWFLRDPIRFLQRADDATQAAIWAEVAKRLPGGQA